MAITVSSPLSVGSWNLPRQNGRNGENSSSRRSLWKQRFAINLGRKSIRVSSCRLISRSPSKKQSSNLTLDMRQKSYLHSTLYSPEPVSSKRNRRKSGYKLSHDSSERASLFSGLTSMRSFDRLTNWRSNKVLSGKSEKDDEFIKKFAVGCSAAAYADEVERTGFLGWLQSKVIVPYGNAYYYWTAIVSVTVTYNVITVVLRSVFDEYQESYIAAWLIIDYLCDMVYIFDMIVKFRTGYLEQGLIVRDLRKLAVNYMKSTRFKLDSISILPTDVLYVFTGLANPTARLNRLLKFPIIVEFAERTESRTSWPNAFRLFTLISCILVIIHLNACLYFAVSEAIGLGSDQWVYDNNNLTDSFSRRYFYSFYWSTLTLTTIGETPYPQGDEEILFNTVDYLIGVLIFATLVGNIGSMITNMNAARTEFQSRIDSIKQFMELHKVDRNLQGSSAFKKVHFVNDTLDCAAPRERATLHRICKLQCHRQLLFNSGRIERSNSLSSFSSRQNNLKHGSQNNIVGCGSLSLAWTIHLA